MKTALLNNKPGLRRMLGAPRRFACRRGFGVHSPFAFSVLESVVRQSCAYYCYPAIDRVARRHGTGSRLLRMAFRLAVFVNAGRYECYGPDSEAVSAALALRGGYSGTGPEVVSVSQCTPEAESAARRALAGGGAVIVSRTDSRESGCASLLERLRSMEWEGIALNGSHTSLLMARKGCLRREYSVWI